MRFDHLPVDAVAGDTIRVISIDRRGVDELRDHARQEGRKTAGQCFPVLEDIAPVACVVQGISSVVVAQDDGELVPWATRVTVAATEPERQILKADPLQVSRAVGLGRLEQFRVIHGVGQRSKKPFVLCGHIAVQVARMLTQILLRKVVVLHEDPTPHNIE